MISHTIGPEMCKEVIGTIILEQVALTEVISRGAIWTEVI
jgi:hypothetical protein